MESPLATSPVQTAEDGAVVNSPSASPLSTVQEKEHAEEKQQPAQVERQSQKQQGSAQGGEQHQKRPSLSVTHGGGGAGASTSSSSSKRTTSRTSSSGHAHRHSSSGSSQRYKETLDATTRHLEDGSRIINQYRLLEVIGQGAYGVVHRACLVHDPSVEFAIKEFGKTRLRKTHRAANLRRPLGRAVRARARGGLAARQGLGRGDGGKGEGQPGEGEAGADSEKEKPFQGQIIPGFTRLNVDEKNGPKSEDIESANTDDPLSLIRHEIAILKKLDHPNVVQLFEVLDDPSRDGLYMVFEYCPDGRVIDVKLHEQVEPLKEDLARDYFIQIMLGIEYLHFNDIVHRDIKPDNILLQDGGKTCKIVDFGVSEMFTKPGDDTLQKSAGSPAFMSPELCTAKHGDYHGRSDDVWSLGVTLYCMVAGRLPFDKAQFLELYESIKSEEPSLPSQLSSSCVDLLQKILCKDPSKRITIAEMRQHPWITQDGKEEVPSMEDNTQALVSEVTDEDLDRAINKIASVFTLARAISKFKRAGSRASSAGSMSDLTQAFTSHTSPQAKSTSVSEEPSSKESEIHPVVAAHIAAGAQTTAHVLSSTSKALFGTKDEQDPKESDETVVLSPTAEDGNEGGDGHDHIAGNSAKGAAQISKSPTGSDDAEERGGGLANLASSVLEKVSESGRNMLESQADTASTLATSMSSASNSGSGSASGSGSSTDQTRKKSTLVSSVKDFAENAGEKPDVHSSADSEEAKGNDKTPNAGKEALKPASLSGSGSPITSPTGERKKPGSEEAPKILTQQPTVSSPTDEDIKPPEGASAAYFGKRDEEVESPSEL